VNYDPGRYVTALACDEQVRVQVSVMHGPAQETCDRHQLRGASARLAAEGLVVATLLSSQIKGEERQTLQIEGTADSKVVGPRFKLTVDVDANGNLRAQFFPSVLPEMPRFDAVLGVVKSLGHKELYRGYASVQQESFEQALQRYLLTSAQVDGRARVLVELDAEGRPSFVAGMLVERLPGFSTEEFAALFDEPLRHDFRSLMTNFAFGQLAGQAIEVLAWQDYNFKCSCSKERVQGTLLALGPVEIQSLIDEQQGAEVTCNFCNSSYRLNTEELRALL